MKRSEKFERLVCDCLLSIVIAIVIIALAGCAYQNTATRAKDGTYTLTSTETEWGSNGTGIIWYVDHAAAEICPQGFEQISQRKVKTPDKLYYTTVIRCVP